MIVNSLWNLPTNSFYNIWIGGRYEIVGRMLPWTRKQSRLGTWVYGHSLNLKGSLICIKSMGAIEHQLHQWWRRLLWQSPFPLPPRTPPSSFSLWCISRGVRLLMMHSDCILRSNDDHHQERIGPSNTPLSLFSLIYLICKSSFPLPPRTPPLWAWRPFLFDTVK